MPELVFMDENPDFPRSEWRNLMDKVIAHCKKDSEGRIIMAPCVADGHLMYVSLVPEGPTAHDHRPS